MNTQTRSLLILCVLFAVLMSLPWLVPHLGALALIGFVPLLCAERIASLGGCRRFWLWHYAAFVLWNAFTTFWVCGATVGGGIFAVLANALQMSLIFGLFRFSKKHLDGVLPYVFLAAAWIAWERWYFGTQISWPWLVLGNAFARTTHCIQWYEYTGTLGGSLWIWAVNLGVFGLMVSLSDGRWWGWNRIARWSAAIGLTLVIAGPLAASAIIYAGYEERSEGTVDVLIGQPDIDPYEKFEAMPQSAQTALLLDIFRDGMKDGGKAPQLLLAPETFCGDIFLNNVHGSATMMRFRDFLREYPHTDLLFGASTYDIYGRRSAPSPYARPYGDGWYEAHNSALVTDSSGRYELFHKSKLVVGTELMPYPKLFAPLDDALGGVMGRCVGQDGISLLHLQDGTPLGCAVCYESVYGEYCTGYVREGAKAIAVITNDAWWGNTPGYRQHLSYSSLRAIELRRDIARCGNTGISAFIDQRGDIVSRTEWWKEASLRGEVNLSSEQTFFVRHGDMAGRVCTFLFLMLLLLLVVRTVSGGSRRGR